MKERQMISFEMLHGEERPVSLDSGLILFFCLRGTCTVRTAQMNRHLNEAALYVLPPLTLHAVECPADAGLLMLRLAPEVLQTAGWTEETSVDCCLTDGGTKDALQLEVRQRYAALFRAFFQDPQDAACREQAAALAALLRQRYAAGNVRASGSAETMARLEKLLRRVQQHWKEPLSLASLAREQFLSESYLARLFRLHMGQTFTEYLTTVRLEHAATELVGGDRSITEIAYDNGFRSVNSFIKFFARKYGQTPGQYRKDRRAAQADARGGGIDGDPADWLQTLLQYDEEPEPHTGPERTQAAAVDLTRPGTPLRHPWRRLVNIGYARDGLVATVQEQLRRAKEEIGFTDIRFHGILDDDMHIYQQKEDGSPWYNFTYADLLFDFLQSVGLTPFVELSFMPAKLVREPYQMFERVSLASMYADEEKWEALVQACVAHWIERYGLKNVLSWRFTVMNFNYVQLEDVPFSYTDYLDLFAATYRAIKALDPRLRLGGPSCFASTIMTSDLPERLLRDLIARGCPPDFLAAQCYPHENIMQDSEFRKFTSSQASTPSVLSKDERFTAHFLHDFRALAERVGLGEREIIVEEWSSTLWQRDLSGDTCYKAAWLFKNILECGEEADLIGYWTLTDFMEEWLAPSGVFHGGYGLCTMAGIPKAGYRAMQLLTLAGEEQVAAGDGWLVSRTGGTIQVFLYHYCHYDAFYRYRYQTLRDPHDAYMVFRTAGDLHITLQLTGLPAGQYRQERHTINRAAGSSFDRWLEMGAPASMRPDDLRYLTETSQPSVSICDRNTTGTLTVEARLSPHEVQVFVLEKRDY